MWFLRSDRHSWMASPPRLAMPRWCGSSALTVTAEWHLHPDWQCPGDVVPPLWPSQLNGLSTQTGNAHLVVHLYIQELLNYLYSVMGWWHLTITDIHNLDTAHIFIRIHLSHCTLHKRVPHWAPKTVARHGSGSTIHVQSPSRATHTAGGIERHTSASVSKSAQAQSEPSGGQFNIQYQQVLR